MLGNTTREEQVGQNVQHAIRRQAAAHFGSVLLSPRQPMGEGVTNRTPGKRGITQNHGKPIV